MAMQLREKPKLSTCARLTAFPDAQYYNCMAENKYRGEVLIELDRPRKFRLTFNEIIEAEELLGEPLDISQLGDSAKKMRAVLYAGLKADAVNDSEPWTLESAGALLGLFNQAAVFGAIMAASMGITTEEFEAKRKEHAAKNASAPETQTGEAGQLKSA